MPNRGQVVWLTPPAGTREWQVFLPTESMLDEHILRVDLDFAYEAEERGREVTRLEAGLSPLAPIPWGEMARVWELFEATHIGGGVHEIDIEMAEKSFRGKLKAPLAAAVAATLLLGAQEWDRMHDWARNLSDWFDHLPDGAVLWSEQLRVTEGWMPDVVAKRVEHLRRLRDRGLPWLSDVFEMAAAAIDGLMARDQAIGLVEIRADLRYAQRFHRPGGMFTVFPRAAGRFAGAPPAPALALTSAGGARRY